MKFSSFRLAVTAAVFFYSAFLFAQQSFQGVAYYQSKTSFDMDGWGRELNEQQKKQIMERMKSMLEKTYVLTFNQAESYYKEEEKLEAPGQGGGFRMAFGGTGEGALYKNVKENQLLQENEFFGKQFLINDTLPKMEWKMGTEVKQIGQYTCFKATAVKKLDEFDWRSMRRRNNDDEKKEAEKKADTAKSTNLLDQIEIPKEIEITVWYTPQIPVSNGPGDYWGLPGLILEVNADKTVILCSKIVMNPEEKTEIKKPSKGKEVTKAEYADIVKKKVEEMQEMYGGRGGRGGFRVRG
ncbi:MAG TPA: GLPGLI family protein [Flavobacteriaceae bacterium]|nr:GLPGLI family protein [Flavobacteriaceae bacterium]